MQYDVIFSEAEMPAIPAPDDLWPVSTTHGVDFPCSLSGLVTGALDAFKHLVADDVLAHEASPSFSPHMGQKLIG